MNLTKDRFFIDTNIIVYMFDKNSEKKNQIATSIVREAIKTGKGVISFQVIQEFCNVSLGKFKTPLSADDCKTFINRFLYSICDIFPGIELYNNALSIHNETGYHFFDSLIIASALKAGCSTLYTEDMQNNQEIKGLRMLNPFTILPG